MKDSGVEWIGEIPDDWIPVKVKYLSTLNGRIGWQGLTSNEYQDSGPYLITGTDFKNGHIDWDTCVHITLKRYEEATQIQIKNEDLLITKDGTIGKVAIVDGLDEKASLNSGVLLIRPINYGQYAVKFCYYILLSDIFWKWYESTHTGNSTIKHLYQEKFKEFSYPLPPLPIQYAISLYLNTKCSLIDSTIEKEREIIGKLKEYRQAVITEAVTKGIREGVPMKESGVEWIGEIPYHWNVSKLKYISSSIGDGLHGTPEYDDEGDYYFINGNNIGHKHLEIKENTRRVNIEEYNKNKVQFFGNTLLISLNGTVGDLSFYQFEPIILSKSAGYINLKEIVSINYVYYFLQAEPTKNYFNISFSGTTINNLSLATLRATSLPFPSLPEQQEIADYLDAKCSDIDATIQKRELAIEKLTAYKQSLIYECVTGKKEVLG